MHAERAKVSLYDCMLSRNFHISMWLLPFDWYRSHHDFAVDRVSFANILKELDLGHLPIDQLFSAFDTGKRMCFAVPHPTA